MHGLVEACRDLPLVVKLMVPSCVPALPFEDAGSVIDAGQTQALLEQPEFFGLGEMMNVPGIVNGDPEACSKVAAAVKLGKPVDGHAPLCTGADLDSGVAGEGRARDAALHGRGSRSLCPSRHPHGP